METKRPHTGDVKREPLQDTKATVLGRAEGSRNRHSAIYHIGILILIVFFCEAVVMVSMSLMFRPPSWQEVFFDSFMLVVLLLPGFYYLVYRPMEKQLRARNSMLDALREQEKRYRLMMEAMHDPVYICSPDYRVIYMNPAMIDRTGRNAMGERCYEVIHHREEICSWCVNHKIQVGEYAEYEVVSPVDGRFYNVAQCPIFYLDGRIDKMVIMRDFTGYKEVEEALQGELDANRVMAASSKALLSMESIEDVSSLILDGAKHLTGSSIGYAGYIDETTGHLICPTFTKEVWDKCRMEKKSIAFKEFNGLWGWVLKNKRPIVSNQVRADPRSEGTPNGHLPIRQFLSNPALTGDKLVGQIALANPKKDYDRRDLALITSLSDLYALAILNFRTEASLRRSRDDLERQVDERTVKLKETNIALSNKITELNAAEDALQRSQQQLQRLSRQLLDSQEEERRLIAMELHDGIGQTLSAIKFKVETGRRDLEGNCTAEFLGVLNSVVSMLQEAIEEVRRICKNLRPSMLDDLGIVATISWFCREFTKVYGGIEVEKEIRLDEEEIPLESKVPIFRILQEALNNTAKHSRADRVRVMLRKGAGGIELLIEDNGRGFDLKTVMQGKKGFYCGLGLASMKERAALSGGSLHIESSPGEGTRIALLLPEEV
ncbi:MAG: GAF domain-containing protein [Deltaproteobacteria bacterium]|nr:GAF domain-containing protein [Deltaproteobacteria bacterium]